MWTQFVVQTDSALAQWAQDKKFVESGLENWVLVNLGYYHHKFKDCWNKWEKILNPRSFIFISIDLFYMQLLISFLSSFLWFFRSPLHKGFFTLYSSFQIILTLHLSFIWDFTWVSVPLNTSSGSLWVVITKVSLFRCLLHINAAKKVVTMHLIRWQRLFLMIFWAFPPSFQIHRTRPPLLSFLEGYSSYWDTNLRYAGHVWEDFHPQTFLHVLLTICWQSSQTFYCPRTGPWPNILFCALTPTVSFTNETLIKNMFDCNEVHSQLLVILHYGMLWLLSC